MTASSRPKLTNVQARRLFLDRHALGETPSGPAKGGDLLQLVDRLGFVQVDSVNTVERAHNMILFSRRQQYRAKNLPPLIERQRVLFEHWTHDASVIPSRFFPHWRLRFERNGERLRERWTRSRGREFIDQFEDVLKRIADQGPVTAGEVGDGSGQRAGGWWDWHPSKIALEYLWQTGQVSICHRIGFQKAYDLTERVIPSEHRAARPDAEESIDWACNAAIDRLGFATSGEIAAFWELATPEDAKAWCRTALERGDLIEIEVACAGDARPRRCFARPDVVQIAECAPEPPSRVRVLSPFDPALRDRKRTERLFGFHYRIEIFVPEEKRKYGYYVFPVLEGDRLIGRIDMKCRRSSGQLSVTAFWPEAGVVLGSGRRRRLESELDRVGRFTGCPKVVFADDWIRDPAA